MLRKDTQVDAIIVVRRRRRFRRVGRTAVHRAVFVSEVYRLFKRENFRAFYVIFNTSEINIHMCVLRVTFEF